MPWQACCVEVHCSLVVGPGVVRTGLQFFHTIPLVVAHVFVAMVVNLDIAIGVISTLG